MFGNFIYFVVALLIYSTYQPSEKTNFPPLDTILLFLSLILLFFIFSRRQFVRIAEKAATRGHGELDQQFSSAMTRQSILAIAFFATDIYGLNISYFLKDIWLFQSIPTIEAIVFMALFIAYLSIIWANAHGAYRVVYQTDISRGAYVRSNIAFSVPVLLPWMLLSGIADLILALPFEGPQRIMNSPEGQTAYFLFFLFAVTVIGPLIIQKFWRCRPLENGYYRKRIEALCERADVKYADILYWPIFGGRMITAGVMGLVRQFRYILVTEALLRILNADEIDAVIAHEVGHVKKRHLLFYLFFIIGFMVIAFATDNLIRYIVIFFEPAYRFIFSMGISRITVVTGLRSILFIAIFFVYFRYIFGYFMRNFERQADTFVYNLYSSAAPLISTFEKIASLSGQSADKPNWHHFSILQRMNFLKKCEGDRSWVHRHDIKVRNSIIAFTIVLLMVGVGGYKINFGQAGKRLNVKYIEQVVLAEIERNGGNAGLYLRLGDTYFEGKSYDKAASAYQNALDMEPKNALVLNNYAWLLATCEDAAIRDPERALDMAFSATAIEKSPHILDTLAESLFVNGRSHEAIRAAESALSMAKTNRSYYEGQLEKFKAAAETPTIE